MATVGFSQVATELEAELPGVVKYARESWNTTGPTGPGAAINPRWIELFKAGDKNILISVSTGTVMPYSVNNDDVFAKDWYRLLPAVTNQQ